MYVHNTKGGAMIRSGLDVITSSQISIRLGGCRIWGELRLGGDRAFKLT